MKRTAALAYSQLPLTPSPANMSHKPVAHLETATATAEIRLFFPKLVCGEHPTTPLIEDHAAGDMICPDCGLVVGDRVIDVSSEWRTFSSSDGKSGNDRSRVGASEDMLMDGMQLTTSIAESPDGADYRQRPSLTSSQQTRLSAFRAISDMTDRVNLPAVVADRAKLYFKEVQESGRHRLRYMDATAAACLFIACRQEGVARSFKEICAISSASTKVMARCYYKIKPLLGFHVQRSSMGDFIPRFCSQLDLPVPMQASVAHVAEKAIQADVFSRRSPLSVVAAAIYLVCQASDANKTSQEVGEVAGVADVTIRQVYKLMLARATHLFPPSFLFKTPIHRLPPK